MIKSSNLIFTNNVIEVKTAIKKIMVKNTNGTYTPKTVFKNNKYVNALVNGSVQKVNLNKVKREPRLNQLQSQLVSLNLC